MKTMGEGCKDFLLLSSVYFTLVVVFHQRYKQHRDLANRNSLIARAERTLLLAVVGVFYDRRGFNVSSRKSCSEIGLPFHNAKNTPKFWFNYARIVDDSFPTLSYYTRSLSFFTILLFYAVSSITWALRLISRIISWGLSRKFELRSIRKEKKKEKKRERENKSSPRSRSNFI